MKQTMSKLSVLLLVAGALLLGACDGIIQPGDVTNIDAAVRGMSYLVQQPEMATASVVGPIPSGDPNHPDRPQDLPGKTTEVYKVTDADGFEELLLMNPSSPTMWLGSILDGNSITTGDYRPIVAPRAPMRISMSALKKSDGSAIYDVSTVVNEPSIGNVRNGINSLVGTNPDALVCTPLSTAFEFYEVNSSSQVSMALGLSYRGWGADVSANLDFSTTRKRTQMVAKFFQVCYTMDVDITTGGPGSYFQPGVTWNDIGSSISSDVSPVIVSSVKYGRMGLFMFESDYSESEVKAALKAAYSGIFGTVGGEITVEQQNIIDSTTFTVLVYGGTAQASSDVFSGYVGFCNWMTSMHGNCEFLDAVPLSYTLSYLKDASVARVVLASEYYKRVVVGEDVPVVVPVYSGVQINAAEMRNAMRVTTQPDSAVVSNLKIALHITLEKYYDDYGLCGSISTVVSSDNYTSHPPLVKKLIGAFQTFNEGLPTTKAYIVIKVEPRISYHWIAGLNPGTNPPFDGEFYLTNYNYVSRKIYLSEFNENQQLLLPIPLPVNPATFQTKSPRTSELSPVTISMYESYPNFITEAKLILLSF